MKGRLLNLQEFAKVMRSRWITVSATAFVTVLASVAVMLLTTPRYEATTRLYVSATGGASVAEAYQGNRLSQERVLSYAELLKGQTLAQRTVEKLDLDITAEALRQNVKADAKPDTVLLSVQVLDESPVRARDIANTLADEFVVLVRELETPEDGSRPDARVVVEQRAAIPREPVVPNKPQYIAIGLALGVLLGVGLAIIRDLLDNTVKDRQTVEAIAGVSVVGTIPLDKARRKEPPISFGNDNSPIAEAFRKLRTNLKFLAVDNPPRVVVVTSSVPSEGKSTTAINIALALAEANHEVVLVDGDMRRPSLARYLDLVGQVGFSTVLSGEVELSEALQKSKYPRLTVLTAGISPPNPSELLGSRTAKNMLANLRADFDYVIVDSSPLLAVTDAAVLSGNCDGVLIMARHGQTKRDQLAYAIENLVDVDAPVLGAVLTMVPERGNTGAYGYGYYGDTTERRTPVAPKPETLGLGMAKDVTEAHRRRA